MQLNHLVVDLKGSLKSANLTVDNDGLFEKCAILCEKYGTSPKELVRTLEAFLINLGRESLALDIMGKFEQHVLQNYTQRKKPRFSDDSPSASASNQTKRSITFTTPEVDSRLSQGDLDISFLSQPSVSSLGTTSSFSNVTFSQRPDKGKVILCVNENLEDRGPFEPSSLKPLGFRCRILLENSDDNNSKSNKVFDNITGRYRYMYTSLEERAKALDNQLFKIQKDMCNLAGIDEEKELQAIGIPSQDIVWVCGRICNEASEGRINKSSILIEGSRRDSGGRRLKVELKDIPSFSLFPGQIVLVEGVASSGRVIVAKRLIEGIPKPLPSTNPAKLLEYYHTNTSYQNGQPVKVIIAAGPFTTSANLSYEPFHELLTIIIKSKPDVVVLIGPFVDVSQPLLESGDVYLDDYDDDDKLIGSSAASYEMVFCERIVRDGFDAIFNGEDGYGTISTQFVLVPSLLDAHHEFVYPQPPFADHEGIRNEYFEEPIGVLNIPFSKSNEPRKRIHLMSNPCMFRINEILFGVTSNDVLFGLSSDEASHNIPGPARLQRLASHILQQQSFNPQFPPPAGSISQMDFRQYQHWQMHQSPDVLIVPSKLTQMAKDILGTLVINPGTLVKGGGGGTYAELNIHPMKQDTIRDAMIDGKSELSHQVTTRTKTSIIKI